MKAYCWSGGTAPRPSCFTPRERAPDILQCLFLPPQYSQSEEI